MHSTAGLTIDTNSSPYEPLKHRMGVYTDSGLRSTVHYHQLREDPSPSYQIHLQGDPPYGLLAFIMYEYAYERCVPDITILERDELEYCGFE